MMISLPCLLVESQLLTTLYYQHECLRFCQTFCVKTVHDEIDRLKLHHLMTNKCKPPNHSIVAAVLSYTYDLPLESESTKESNIQSKNISNTKRSKMYCFNNRPYEFMNSQMWTDAIMKIITMREEYILSQEKVDSTYNDLVYIFYHRKRLILLTMI